MWGEYTDTLYCQIEGIDSAFGFKFKINVIGCPLHLHSMPEVQQPIVRFGIHPFEKARVSRKIRINNTSPCDIRIDWRVFTQVSHGDHNVVDFEMTYGNPFPSHSRTITYSDQCVLESDLISVFLRPHDSIQNTNTFMITPEQCTIEGYSNVTCEFTFFPTANNLSELGEDISGYALGYLSLDVPPEYPDSVYRPQGKLISPLRVDFHGGIMHPKIEIAPVNSDLDEEVLGFAFPASKLMKINSLGQFQSIKSAYQTFQQITIQNPTKQKLSFDIILPSELKISEYNQLAPNESSDLFSLKPNQIVTLKIGFTLEAKHITSSLDTTQTDWSIQTNKDEHKYLTYKQNIRVEFPSKIAQFLSVEARIELPLLKLSTDVINFGETQIGEKFSQQFCVYNYARKCYSKWRADIRPDDSSILAIDCNEGLLPGFDGGFDFSSKILLISFSPLDEIDYEFEVIISGEFLEIPLSLKVYGSGSII